MTTKQQPGPRPIIPLGDLWAMEETAFQQLGELLQRVDLTALLAGRAPSRWERLVEVTDDGLGIVEIAGLLVKAHTIFGWFFRETAYPDIQHAIEELSRRRDVKKIVLLVDSPGGTVAGVAEAADAIFKARSAKPIVAQVAALCCSAAYWLAAQAHQIFAHRLDHIGFVGVRALLYDYSRAFEKAGVRPVVADTGEYKSLGVRGTPITEPHREYLQALVDATFGEFQLAVKTGRGLSVSRIQDIADGRVFTAADAVRLGLIDSIRTTVETLAKMRPPKKPPWQMSETELRAEWDVAVREAHRSVPHRYHGDHRTAMAEQIARQEHERLWFELQQARSRQRAPVQETAPPPPQPVESATTRFEQQIAKRMQSGEDRRTALRAVIRADGRLHKEWLAEQNQRANRPAAARTLLAQAPSDSKGTP